VNLWLGGVVVAGSVTIVLAVIFFARKRIPVGGLFTDSDRAAGSLGVLGTSFAVLLAFVIFLGFESYGTARERSSAEAIAVTELYRDAQLFDEPTRSDVQGMLICYARAVIHDEWPAMAGQRTSPVVERWIDRLDATVDTADITGAREQAGYSNWLSRMTERREGRRGRIGEASSLVPQPLWATLLLGAVLLIGYMCFYADPGEKYFVQAMMIGSVTALVVSGVLLVRFLDLPYENQLGSIQPTEMIRTLGLMEDPGELRGRPEVIPCDDRGIPTDT
jgi:Protein of unknown function (DUF4239)